MIGYPQEYGEVKSPKTKTVGSCVGSGKKRTTTRGRKSGYYGVKYPCPECSKLIGCDSAGNFNKHGWTRKAVYKGATSICSECGGEIQGIDYLCAACRA